MLKWNQIQKNANQAMYNELTPIQNIRVDIKEPCGLGALTKLNLNILLITSGKITYI
jgi:hypothetical protein